MPFFFRFINHDKGGLFGNGRAREGEKSFLKTYVFRLETRELRLDTYIASAESAIPDLGPRHGFPLGPDFRPALHFDLFHVKQHPVFHACGLIRRRDGCLLVSRIFWLKLLGSSANVSVAIVGGLRAASFISTGRCWMVAFLRGIAHERQNQSW